VQVTRVGRVNLEFKGFYKVMGVARERHGSSNQAGPYRKLAAKIPPDVSKEKDADPRFKELRRLRKVLKTPGKARRVRPMGRGPRPGEEFSGRRRIWGSGFEFRWPGRRRPGDPSEFFESLFGGAAGAARGGRRGFEPGRGSRAPGYRDPRSNPAAPRTITPRWSGFWKHPAVAVPERLPLRVP